MRARKAEAYEKYTEHFRASITKYRAKYGLFHYMRIGITMLNADSSLPYNFAGP
jgi:hypothetical protein